VAQSAQDNGICPHCQKRFGPPGHLCSGEDCKEQGYHFIPKAWFESARDFAFKRGKPVDPLLGRKIERYFVVGKLGEGGMGAVYLAWQEPLGREVALKLISGLELTNEVKARFEREARAISVLDHPNIVKLYDYGIANIGFELPFMALEYVKHGRNLRLALAKIREENGGRIPGDVILTIFEQVLNALGAAHEIGIIHRDMKPENIMVARAYGNPYFVKVLDFGLAKAIQDMTGFQSTLSHAGQLLGTPYYMAPEQGVRKGGGQAVDHRCDLYAVAVMLFEVFAGVRPYEGTTPLDVLTKKIDPNYRPLDLPEAKALLPGLRAVIERGLQVDPERRFSSAGEMKEALKGALTGQVTTALGLVWKDISSSQQKPITPQSPGVEPVKPRVKKHESFPQEKDKQHAFDVIWEAPGEPLGPNGTRSATPSPPESRSEEPSAVAPPRSSKMFWFFALLVGVLGVAVWVVEGLYLTPTGYSGARFVDNGDGTVTDKKYGLVWSKRNFGVMEWRDAVEYCRENRAGLPGSGWHLPTIDELRQLIIGCPATEPGGRCPAREGCRSVQDCYGADPKGNCAPCEEHKGPGPEGCYMDKGFDDPCNLYWSSTPPPWSSSMAFFVPFSFGVVLFADMGGNFFGVRCVRAGEASKEAVPTETRPNVAPTDDSGARFVDNGDGTVTDKKYGLVWSKKNFGDMTWENALEYCRENRAGLPGSGWHLPTIGELRTLIIGCPATESGGRCPAKEGCRSEQDCYGGDWKANCAPCKAHKGLGPEGCYMDKAFDDPCYFYWSSTRCPWSSSAFSVHFLFYDGSVYSEDVYFLNGVRCVRRAQH